MAIVNKRSFLIGLGLFITFFVVLLLIFSPLFQGRNGLEYADDLFNKLSKGSSYFIPRLLQGNEKAMAKNFQVSINMENARAAEETARLFADAGVRAEVQGTTLQAGGDLGRLLGNALRDADEMFQNEGSRVKARYGYDEKRVMLLWWTALSKMEKFFKKNLQIEESNMVSEVIRKGIEPAYNFYQIEPQQVSDRAGIMTLLLVFYVVYTLWWGFAIYYLFEGLGLSMRKARVRKEVG